MAYPTGMLSFVLEDIDRTIASIKLTCQQVRAESLAGAVPSSRILDLFINLQGAKLQLNAAAAVPGLAQFARDQKNNPSLDVVAEFTNVVNTLTSVVDWINTNFPKDAGGFLLAKSFSGTLIVDRTFSTATLVNLRATLDSLIATIA